MAFLSTSPGRTLGEDLTGDLRYGLRRLARAPSFAGISIFTLALGIGAATAVFSVVDGVLLRPLPYPEPDRILRLFQIGSDGGRMNVSEPNFDDWKAGLRSFRAMAQIAPASATVSLGDERVVLGSAAVSREFFEGMGVQPAVGRAFVEEERRPGGRAAVIVSDRVWQARLGAAPLPDLTLRIGDEVHDVVGVMPPAFNYPTSWDYLTPRERLGPQRSRTAHNFQVIARLADGVPLRLARTEISELSRSLKARYGEDTWMADAAAIPLREQLTASVRPALALLARSFARVVAVDPGFRTDNALILDLTWSCSPDPAVRERRVQTGRELLARLRALPGMQDTGLVSAFPIGPGRLALGAEPADIRRLVVTRGATLAGFGMMAGLAAAAIS